MAKTIKIKQFDPGDSCLIVSGYPGPGIYEIPKDKHNYYLNDGSAVWVFLKDLFNINDQEHIQEESPGIQIEGVLKLIAVSKKPELAFDDKKKDID